MTLTTLTPQERATNDLTTRRDHRLYDWKSRLDARISRCPGCDQWRWDDTCKEECAK